MAVHAAFLILLEGFVLCVQYGAALDTGQTSQSAAIDLTRTPEGFYVASVGVFGLHPKVLVDTGSGDFWINSEVAMSLTGQAKGRPFHIAYGSGTASGTVQTAEVTLPGGLDANCEIGVSSREDGLLQKLGQDGQIDGVWGLAPGGGVQGLVQCLRSKNLLQSGTAVLTLRTDGGSLTLGNEPSGLVHFSTVGDNQWMVPLTDVSVVHSRSSVVSANLVQSSSGALLDSGSSGLHAPAAAVHEMAIELSALEKGNDLLVRCESADAVKLRLNAEFGEVSIDIPVSLMMGGHVSDGLCQLKLAESSSGQWVLGDAFFQRVKAVVFNYDTRTVGIAGLEIHQTGHGAEAAAPEMSTADNAALSIMNSEVPSAVAAVEASLPSPPSDDAAHQTSSDVASNGLKAAALSAHRLAEATAGAFDGVSDADQVQKQVIKNKWENMREDVEGTIYEYFGPNATIATDPAAEEVHREAEQGLDSAPTHIEAATAAEAKAQAATAKDFPPQPNQAFDVASSKSAERWQTDNPTSAVLLTTTTTTSNPRVETTTWKLADDWTLDNIEVNQKEVPLHKSKHTVSARLRASLPVSQDILDASPPSPPIAPPAQSLPEASRTSTPEVLPSMFGAESPAVQTDVDSKTNGAQTSDNLVSNGALPSAKPSEDYQEVDWSDILDKKGETQLERDVHEDLTVEDFAPPRHAQPLLGGHPQQSVSVNTMPVREAQVTTSNSYANVLDDQVVSQTAVVTTATTTTTFEIEIHDVQQQSLPAPSSEALSNDVQPSMHSQEEAGYFDLGDMWKKARTAARQLRNTHSEAAQAAETANGIAAAVDHTDAQNQQSDPFAGAVPVAASAEAVAELNPTVPTENGPEVTVAASSPIESTPAEDTPSPMDTLAASSSAESMTVNAAVPVVTTTADPEAGYFDLGDMWKKAKTAARQLRNTQAAETANGIADAWDHAAENQQTDPFAGAVPVATAAETAAELTPALPTENGPEVTVAASSPTESTPAEDSDSPMDTLAAFSSAKTMTVNAAVVTTTATPDVEESIPDRVSEVPEPFRFERAASAIRHLFHSPDDSEAFKLQGHSPIPSGVDEAVVDNFLHRAWPQRESESRSVNPVPVPAQVPDVPRAPELPYVSPVTEAAFSVEGLAKLDKSVTEEKVMSTIPQPQSNAPSPADDQDLDQDMNQANKWTHAWNSKDRAAVSLPSSADKDTESMNHESGESSEVHTLQGMLPSSVTVPSLEMAAQKTPEIPKPAEDSVIADLGDFWGKGKSAAHVPKIGSLSSADQTSSLKASSSEVMPHDSSDTSGNDASGEASSYSNVAANAKHFAAAAEEDAKALDSPDDSPILPESSNAQDWLAVQRMSHSLGAEPWIEDKQEAVQPVAVSARIPDHYSEGLKVSEALNEAGAKTHTASWYPPGSDVTVSNKDNDDIGKDLDDAEDQAKRWVQKFRQRHLSLLATSTRTYRM